MTIFSQATENSTSTEEEVFETPTFEGYGDDVNGDILALQESWEDRLAVIEAIHSMDSSELAFNQEVKQLKESGSDEEAIQGLTESFEAVTESAMQTAWERIKKFFADLGGKLKAFLLSVLKSYDLLTKSAEEFAAKHGKDMEAKKGNGFKFKMFDYTNLDSFDLNVQMKGEIQQKFAEVARNIAGATDDNADKLLDIANSIKESKADVTEKYRGELVSSGPLTADEYKQRLYSFFRNGAKNKDSKVEVTVDPSKLLAAMKNKAGRDQVVKAQQEMEKEFSEVLKHLALVAKDVKSGDVKQGKAQQAALEAVRAYTTVFSIQKDIAMQAFRAWKTAWFERDVAYKAAALGLIHSKPASAQ